MTQFNEYDQFDGLGLAKLIAAKQVTAIEVIEAAISQIEKHNPQLNAVIHKMYDYARLVAQQDGPSGIFQGVPLLIKDLGFDFAAQPTHGGSQFLRHFVPEQDAEIIKRHKNAGLIIVGKTNLPEFGMSYVTEPKLFGATLNPWHFGYTPGGSSGGSAAAVAAGLVPIATANDGGGSIRVPASCCGLFGLKPSRGRTPLGPVMGKGWQGLVSSHALTRTVRDSAAMLDVTAGADIGAAFNVPENNETFLAQCKIDPKPLRIAYWDKPLFPTTKDTHEDCKKALQDAIKICVDLGHEIIEIKPEYHSEQTYEAFITVLSGELASIIEELAVLMNKRINRKDFELVTYLFSKLGTKTSGAAFAHATHVFDKTTRQIAKFFTQYDILLTPTLAQPPLLIGEFANITCFGKILMNLSSRLGNAYLLKKLMINIGYIGQSFAPNTALFNVTGNPAMSMPLWQNQQGLPIGTQFVGRMGDEKTLIRLAAQIERARPFKKLTFKDITQRILS